MRWEYESPQTKLFVADGKTVWFFVPADHTATRAPMKESTDWRTPLALLTGKTQLSKLCDRIDIDTEAAPATPELVTLRCLPRGEGKKSASASSGSVNGDASLAGPDQPFDKVLLQVNRDTGELADVRVLQPGGVELDFRFGNWVENLPIAGIALPLPAAVGCGHRESIPPRSTDRRNRPLFLSDARPIASGQRPFGDTEKGLYDWRARVN